MENLNPASKTEENWYYVIIQNPGTSEEQVIGYEAPETFEKFVPAFKTKEQAQSCFSKMPKDFFTGQYDAHAIIEDDLLAMANENGRMVYLLDENGTILDCLTPLLRS